jgi:hypothetical protein
MTRMAHLLGLVPTFICFSQATCHKCFFYLSFHFLAHHFFFHWIGLFYLFLRPSRSSPWYKCNYVDVAYVPSTLSTFLTGHGHVRAQEFSKLFSKKAKIGNTNKNQT